jgi:hypothetical protein
MMGVEVVNVYHAERNHQGLSHQRTAPEPSLRSPAVR